VANVDRGFSAARVLAVDVALPGNRYTDPAVTRATYDRVLAAIHALPGVQTVTTTSMLPLAGEGQVNSIAPDGSTRPRSEQPSANFRFVAPEFFATLALPLQRGRSFTAGERDPQRPMPAVVSESVAARLWPGADAIGRRFSRQVPGEQGFEVVGIAADAKTTSLETAPPLMVYVPYWWGRSRPSASLMIRTAVDPASLGAGVRRAIQQIDPEIAVGDSRPLDALVGAALAGRRYQMRLFVAFGLVALVIATVGVYAVTSYAVSRRRREMNIRVAIGAPPSQVFALIVRQGSAALAAGLALGAAGATVVGGLVASLLFEVPARDPIVIAAVVSVVGAAGLIASMLAARHGLALDPAAALRED